MTNQPRQPTEENRLNRPKPFSYSLNDKMRILVMRMMALVTSRSKEERLDFGKERIERILLVRAIFRLGDSILATPAIFLFRRNFPHARIDFVGAPIAKVLYRNLPVDHLFTITKRFPDASWAYLALLKQIRSVGYDLAVDVSASKSAIASFIVGFSGARFRVGCRGKRDRWFNVRTSRPREKNKYRVLPAFLAAMGLETQEILPSLILTHFEKEEGKRRVGTLFGPCRDPVVGVFVGGRKILGKRWPMENFLKVTRALSRAGVKVIVFVGPEEKKLIRSFKQALEPAIPVVFEPSVRIFAAMVFNCQLFITSDSGPMHLACALGLRTIAVFQNPNFEHWRPPANLCRVLYEPGGILPEEVAKISLAELSCGVNHLQKGAESENKTGLIQW
jgi:ADP-heptose:LPS heptosyltransferase